MKNILQKIVLSSLLGMMVAVPAFAETSNNTSTVPINQTINTACVQSAVQKRETALQSAAQTYASAIQSAMSARSSALQAAWGNTDRKVRRTAISDALKAFRAAKRSATQTMQKADRDAWKQFATDRKTCGITSSEGDMQQE